MNSNTSSPGSGHAAIREILLNDWDPHNVASRLPEASGAYDVYLQPLADLIHGGGTADQIIEWLHEREKESMCFPPLGTQRLRRVAAKLVDVGRDLFRQERGSAG